MAEGSERLAARLPHARPLDDSAARRTTEVNIRPKQYRRTVAGLLSAVVPGLGQAFNGRGRTAVVFVVPVIVLAGIVTVALAVASKASLLATLIEPETLQVLLVLDLAVLAWRLAAIGQAFFDRRYPAWPGRFAGLIFAVVLLLTVAPHAIAFTWIQAAQTGFARVFQASPAGSDTPIADGPLTQRINVLIVGTDNTSKRTEMLTDTMMVASLDPVGDTVSLVSIPRDLVNVPLGGGSVFGPKLNSLMSYADRHPKQFPQGGLRTLQDALGALLGIHIDYYARLDFSGFVKLVDAVGGIDVDVDHAFADPHYDGFAIGTRGFAVTAGPHHFDGATALAYARVRKAIGESDFTRQARQQQVLVALRDRLLDGGTLFWRVPGLLGSLGDFVTTDVPIRLVPRLAEIADSIGRSDVARAVIMAPLIKPAQTRYGDVQLPNIAKIQAMAAALFPAPGTEPVSWPPSSSAPSSRSSAPPSADPSAATRG
jgi:polyisoprenyl-teichoic acid--peptidoglycan teichoic acid transferase